jgi:hypothetical protein
VQKKSKNMHVPLPDTQGLFDKEKNEFFENKRCAGDET